MANTKSAEKAARRAETNRTRNVALRSRMRSALRKVNDALASGKKADPKRQGERHDRHDNRRGADPDDAG